MKCECSRQDVVRGSQMATVPKSDTDCELHIHAVGLETAIARPVMSTSCTRHRSERMSATGRGHTIETVRGCNWLNLSLGG